MSKEQIYNKPKTKTFKKNKILWIFGTVSFLIIISILAYYKYIFRNFTVDANVEHFAQFGDFIGGILNPILAFLAFIALLYTIKLQSDALQMSKEELKATREELARSAKAQEEQSKSLKLQNEATKLQIFENTFFTLLKEVNELLDSLVEKKHIENRLDSYKNYVTRNLNTLNNKVKEKNRGLLKTYFIMLYQLLKLINESNIKDKKKYTNIVRANLDDDTLYLLAINCEVLQYINYKKYLEEYKFFEHLNYDNDDFIIFNFILKKYDIKVFGKNFEIIDYMNNEENTVRNRMNKAIV